MFFEWEAGTPMCISCRHVDVHKRGGVGLVWTGSGWSRGSKTGFSCGLHKL